MWRLRVPWTGPSIAGPGLSTFYALDTSPGFPAAVRALLASFASYVPAGVSIQVPNSGDVLDPATGALTGVWTDGSTPAVINTSGPANYAAGVGCQWRWRTSGIVAGRRVVGSTFIVPLSSAEYDSSGTIDSVAVTALNAAAATYVTNAPYAVIWSRPKGARVGSSHLITSGFLPDRVSWLRSRRT